MLGKQVLRFKIGDWIVHASYGIGKVVDIVEKDMDGHREKFFRVSTEDIEYWLPVEKADAEHITPIRSEKDFNQAIQIMSKPPKPMTEPQNQYKRLINQRWLDGSLPARAALIRDLNGRNAIKRLNYDEKETCNKAEKSFIEEWIITNPSLSRSVARRRLDDALATSLKKGSLQTE